MDGRRIALGIAVLLMTAACSAIRTGPAGIAQEAGFDDRLYPSVAARDLDLVIDGRDSVRGPEGTRLSRIRFSFVAYSGYADETEVRRSTATLFLPLAEDGSPEIERGDVLIAEFPPGSSAASFDLMNELGVRPAALLGVPAAVVDVRGPVLRDLGRFENPDAIDGASFKSEEQFAYAMLRSYQETGDFRLLWEQRVGTAWLRAVRATDVVLAREAGARSRRFVLAAERRGALGACQAAAVDASVHAVIACGWPLDWFDYHFVRWRRWERDSRYMPLAAITPSPYDDSASLLSFLSSSFGNPDPGCPPCVGTGQRWLGQFDLARLATGPLADVRLFLLVGDSDPDLPIDLEARSSAPLELLATSPAPEEAMGASRGPFAEERPLPFDDLRYLTGSTSTLAHPEAAESILAWLQHMGGYRDRPRLRIEEAVADGDVRVTLIATEGNAVITGVELRLLEIDDAADSDFKASLHRKAPKPLAWRRVDPLFAGPDASRRSSFPTARWRAFFPVNPSANQAYYVVVRTRVGALPTAHSLPIRAFWNRGDPAVGPARF